jgi:hypothetical protein
VRTGVHASRCRGLVTSKTARPLVRIRVRMPNSRVTNDDFKPWGRERHESRKMHPAAPLAVSFFAVRNDERYRTGTDDLSRCRDMCRVPPDTCTC